MRFEEISRCQESRPMVSKDVLPKNRALADARLWRLCIMLSIVTGMAMA